MRPILVLCVASTLPCLASARDESFHWAYATHFGTGRYTLDGRTETVVLSVSPGWTWREPSLGSDGSRTIGYRFRFPVAVGTTEFESLDAINDLGLDSISALSVVPGVEIEIPVTGRWSLKPLAYLGLGAELGGGEHAGIFRLGLRSRLVFDLGDTDMHLVNAVERIGYSESGGSSDAFNLVLTGLDFSRPLENSRIGGERVVIGWHVMYTSYVDSLGLDIRAASLRPATISGEWELGVSFGKQSSRLRLWRLKFDRVGLAYRFDSEGDFSGIGIVFKALFDR